MSRLANPVSLARRVLDDGRHVLLAGNGALAFARAVGMPECDPASLITERRRRRLHASTAKLKGTVGVSGTLPGMAPSYHEPQVPF